MKIVKAGIADLDTIRRIVRDTIRAVYPRYYPKGAVDFFLAHHSDENIIKDITAGNVCILLNEEGQPAGTVTTAENELNRLFVLPEYQGHGYGGELIRFAENIIFEKYDRVVLSASLPAKKIYLKRGYSCTEYNMTECPNGDFLCYDEMIKLRDN